MKKFDCGLWFTSRDHFDSLSGSYSQYWRNTESVLSQEYKYAKDTRYKCKISMKLIVDPFYKENVYATHVSLATSLLNVLFFFCLKSPFNLPYRNRLRFN